jgi:hypothetical protein
MNRLTLADLFNRSRTYLDTDELNFPNPLCDTLLRRIWFQAVTMEREWRFFQRQGSVPVAAGTALVPFAFETLPAQAVPATRLLTVMWNDQPLVWRELSTSIRTEAGGGNPVTYSEQNNGLQRNVALFPAPAVAGTLNVTFFAEPVYPEDPTYLTGFLDLPEEFDWALLEGLLAEMYSREEDMDLYDVHRQNFLEQMGSVRNRWRESLATPLVMAGRGRLPGKDPGGFNDRGIYTLPTAG